MHFRVASLPLVNAFQIGKTVLFGRKELATLLRLRLNLIFKLVCPSHILLHFIFAYIKGCVHFSSALHKIALKKDIRNIKKLPYD